MSALRASLRGLFTLTLLLSLGFGVSEALATPENTRNDGTCTPEQEFYCLDYCVQNGGDGAFCSYGQCYCY